MIVYFDGSFMPKDEVRISPDDRGFLFGDGVYEVLHAWDGHLFEPEAHFARLEHSLAALRIGFHDLDGLRFTMDQLLRLNALMHGAARVYCQITRGAAHRDHAFPDPAVPPTVYVAVEPYAPPIALWETGVPAITVADIRWGRCDIKSLNLLGNILATQEAKEAGAYDAILVRDGVVTEGSHTGVCAVFDGTVVTHALTPEILGSVTRDFVLRSCRDLGTACAEREIPVASLYEADEVMLLGTTSGIMPVIEIDGRAIGSGCPGPVTRRLQEVLHSRMLGGTPRA
ncbi:MAG: D-amino acid aminotransferase [Anaerolineae bacterium]|nr:D-amino acid aminotransferase [Anaerolineae bacterium]